MNPRPFTLAIVLAVIILATTTFSVAAATGGAASKSDNPQHEYRRQVCVDMKDTYGPLVGFYSANKFHKHLIQQAEKVAFQMNYSFEYHKTHGVDFTCHDSRDIIAEAEVGDLVQVFKKLMNEGTTPQQDGAKPLRLPPAWNNIIPFENMPASELVEKLLELQSQLEDEYGAEMLEFNLLEEHIKKLQELYEEMWPKLKKVYDSLMETTKQNANAEKDNHGISGMASNPDKNKPKKSKRIVDDQSAGRDGERKNSLKSETLECQKVYTEFITIVTDGMVKRMRPIGASWDSLSNLINGEIQHCIAQFPDIEVIEMAEL